MSTNIPRYFPPPRGYRTRWDGPTGFTRRDKEEGPYGIFIETDMSDAAIPLSEYDDISPIVSLWESANRDIHSLLWGDQPEREVAAMRLRDLNLDIRAVTGFFGLGIIEIQNWYNAGQELFKARFEDVRDFIWERIQIMHYPTEWRVKFDDFAWKIDSCAGYVAKIRETQPVDTDDSVFNEWLLENLPQPNIPPPSYEHSQMVDVQGPAALRSQTDEQNRGSATAASQVLPAKRNRFPRQHAQCPVLEDPPLLADLR
ncbi:hypothetical protein EYZ11_008379 [Aspergillus tanneri]|uniref:Uncharacterized protein n=1 Tax=Aspergillus tanneri TaxID=1220188 RepID=A0A4V3UNR1_9EURO|nr:hypothetical protein EYZ11_008379 [Aspergillus tanneri]